MKRSLACLIAVLGMRTAAAIAPADFAWTFPVETDDTSANAWRVELTPEAYAWIQDDGLRDTVVFNAAGQPVPTAPAEARNDTVTREHRIPLPLLALPASTDHGTSDLRLIIERDGDGRLHRIDAGEQTAPRPGRLREWLVDAGSIDRPVEALLLDWSAPPAGVSARFSLAASDDLQRWRDLGQASVVSLEQDGMRIDRRELQIPPTRASYFRLRRLDDGAALENLSAQARLTESERRDSARRWVRAVAQRRDATADSASFDYELPGALPIDRARIELADDNAARSLTLSVPPVDGRTPAHVLARIDAFRLRVGGDLVQNEDIALSLASRERRFRIEARTPLAHPPSLMLGYRPDALVFLAEGPGPYVLAVGSRTARRPDAPVAAVLSTLRGRFGNNWQPPVARLGNGRVSGGDAVLREPSPPMPWRQWLLWGVLALGAALVGGFAWSLLRGGAK